MKPGKPEVCPNCGNNTLVTLGKSRGRSKKVLKVCSRCNYRGEDIGRI